MADMDFKAAEIAWNIQEKILNNNQNLNYIEVGKVISVKDGIATIYGIEKVKLGEMITFQPSETKGLVQSIDYDSIGAVILGETSTVREGDEVRRTNKFVEIPVGMEVIGRLVDALGNPLDEKGAISTAQKYKIERDVPGIMERQPVKESLLTGYTAIDSLIPIGRGQRQLIIGDRQTGKTTIGIDTILAQKEANKKATPKDRVYCIYVSIGQKRSTVARIAKTLEDQGAMFYTSIVVASASEAAALQFLAPYTGCSMGEYFRDNGMNCLIIYDDLSKHAVAYRQMSLLLRRPPGREAYPGDVFYIHSRLLERAAKLSNAKGGGSLTALPIIETQAGDVAAYIPTNVISITDGQIFLETQLFNKGVRPAVNVGLSVSRVGSAAQSKAMKQVAGSIKLELAQYREMEAFSQFGSDLDEITQRLLSKGKKFTELLNQKQHEPLTMEEQVIIIFSGVKGFLDKVNLHDIANYKKQLLSFMYRSYPEVLEKIRVNKVINDEKDIRVALEAFNKQFIKV